MSDSSSATQAPATSSLTLSAGSGHVTVEGSDALLTAAAGALNAGVDVDTLGRYRVLVATELTSPTLQGSVRDELQSVYGRLGDRIDELQASAAAAVTERAARAPIEQREQLRAIAAGQLARRARRDAIAAELEQLRQAGRAAEFDAAPLLAALRKDAGADAELEQLRHDTTWRD